MDVSGPHASHSDTPRSGALPLERRPADAPDSVTDGAAWHRAAWLDFARAEGAGATSPFAALPVGRLLAADPAPLRMAGARRVATDRATWLIAAVLLLLAFGGAVAAYAAGLVLWPAAWLGLFFSKGGVLPFVGNALVLLLVFTTAGGILLRQRGTGERTLGAVLTRYLMRKRQRAARAHLRGLEGRDGLLLHFKPLLEGLASAPGCQVDRLRLPFDQLDALKSLGSHPRVRRLFERLETGHYDRVDLETYRYVLTCLQAMVRAASEHFNAHPVKPIRADQ